MFSIRERIREEIKTVVSPSETITLIIRQSLWHSISPSALILTDRRLILIHHSFWGLYIKINLINPTEINIVQHMNIMSVALGRGLIFGTVRLRVHGFVEPTPAIKYEWDLAGMWIKDALKITNVVGRVIEERSEAQDAKMSPTNLKEGSNEEENTKRSDMALNAPYKETTMEKAQNPQKTGKTAEPDVPQSTLGEKKADKAEEPQKAPNGSYDGPLAYIVKNDKVIATEKIDVPIQN